MRRNWLTTTVLCLLTLDLSYSAQMLDNLNHDELTLRLPNNLAQPGAKNSKNMEALRRELLNPRQAGSCSNQCGSSSGTCDCHPDCRIPGARPNCCPDFATECRCFLGTCKGACTQDVNTNAARYCKCTNDCAQNPDDPACCHDYAQSCPCVLTCNNRCGSTEGNCICSDDCKQLPRDPRCCPDYNEKCICTSGGITHGGTCNSRCGDTGDATSCSCSNDCFDNPAGCCGDFKERCDCLKFSCDGRCGATTGSCICSKDKCGQDPKDPSCCPDYSDKCMDTNTCPQSNFFSSFSCKNRCGRTVNSFFFCKCTADCLTNRRGCCRDFKKKCKDCLGGAAAPVPVIGQARENNNSDQKNQDK